MIVKIFDYDPVAGEVFRAQCDLHECFPDDSRDPNGVSEFLVALGELNRSGRYWVGGGAAPLVLLQRVQP
jgi:hypothetical protein